MKKTRWSGLLIFWGIGLFTQAIFTQTIFAQEKAPWVDISAEKARQTVIAPGTPEIYQGHPYSVMLPDGETVYCVWNIEHGGHAGPMAKSVDGGRTWERLDDRLPKNYRKYVNCPSIFYTENEAGDSFLWVLASQPKMPRILSTDGGKTWKEMPALGLANVMTFSSMIPKNPGVRDGCYLAFYHHRCDRDGKVQNAEPSTPGGYLEVVLVETTDAGWTWSAPRVVASVPGKSPCEPFAFWSPDKKEICVLMRENQGAGGENRRALMMFSQDRGTTWSTPTNTSWELTGHRHMGTYLPDGRLFFAFRDTAPGSKMGGERSADKGAFVGWIGRYEDVKKAGPGDYRIKLLHSYAGWDQGYPGVFVRKDGTVVVLTYIKYEAGPNKHSIVAVAFRPEELDQKARLAQP